MKTRMLFISTAVILVLFFNLSITFAKMYSYTDDKGIIHYQDHPPENISPEITVEELETFETIIQNENDSKENNGARNHEKYKREFIYLNKTYTFKGKDRVHPKQDVDLTLSKDGLRWKKTKNGRNWDYYVSWEAIEYWYIVAGGISVTYFTSKALKLHNPKSLVAFHFDLPYGDEQLKLAEIFIEMVPERQKK